MLETAENILLGLLISEYQGIIQKLLFGSLSGLYIFTYIKGI